MLRKIFFSSLLVGILPLVAAASFDSDLYYGMRNNPDVKQLQEFLQSKGVYGGPVTGNFFSLTQAAVKKFQEAEGIAPVSGYFGPKTRARANAQVSAPASFPATVEEILAKIKALQEQIRALQALAVPAPVSTTTPASEATSTTSTATTTPIAEKTKTLKISGVAAAKTFPDVASGPYKIGDIVLQNDTSGDILLASIQVLISDEMDSLFNRNHKIFWLVRDGENATDDLVSRTDFTFVLASPAIGSPYRAFLMLPVPVSVKAGQKKVISLWEEQLLFVRSGTLTVESTAVSQTGQETIEGSFKFVLTKEPSL